MELNDIILSGLLELYVTGLTSAEETTQVEVWANQYPEVKKELTNLQTAMETYALGHSIQPDPYLKKKIFSHIPGFNVNVEETEEKEAVIIPFSSEKITQQSNVRKQQAQIITFPSSLKWMVAACLILLIGSIAINFNYYSKYKAVDDDLVVAQNELQHQKDVAAAMHKDMEVMSDKNALNVSLNGTPVAPEAAAKIYWMKNTGEVYVDPTYLPQVPAGKQYQLWAIVDGKPVDAGMINTPKGTYHIQKMKTFGKAQAFAITLEKAGGSPTPDMNQMYVMAKI